jgi:N-acetylneuraminate synthase
MIQSTNFKIGPDLPTYFIADIAANHDGSLERALQLIELAAASGANAAKFQNFRAETIVSKRGFEELGQKLSHQATWSRSVFDVYKEAELPIYWTEPIIEKCNELGIDYFTAPYDLDYVDFFGPKVPFFKVGSGDITWLKSIEAMCKWNIPIFLATGASDMEEVKRAVSLLEDAKVQYVLMQCNTNYENTKENFQYINLEVLKSYRSTFNDAILGLSDHTPGHVTVLGAVALGARVIEKHFTDDNRRPGPDHAFSLNPAAWSEMVTSVRQLESALGDGNKRVEDNERAAQIVQRRAIRTAKKLESGHVLQETDLVSLRPCPLDGIAPSEIEKVVGKVLKVALDQDSLLTWSLIE